MRRAVIVGGGAAGLIAAGTAARRGVETLVVERSSRPARKILVTGKGRCNVTNNCDREDFLRNVPRNPRFLYAAYNALSPQELMALVEEQGVPLKTERGRRVFPCSDKAMDIADALQRYAASAGSKVLQGRAVALRLEEDRVTGVSLESGETISCDSLLVATGGLSYPGTGSTGDGYALAKQAGHSIVPCVPSLVPLTVENGFVPRLQGLSLRNIQVRAVNVRTGKVIFEDFGELLFTHFGLSGPVILSMSAHLEGMEPGKYAVHLDLKPALSPEQLDQRLLRDFFDNRNRDFINALNGLLPRRLAPVMVALSGISPSTKVHQVTKEQRRRLAALLKDMVFPVRGFRPVEEAVVTRGGVNVKEVNPRTMASRLAQGLFFAGEVLDVDGYTGGYNLQIAFSTGYLAGLNL